MAAIVEERFIEAAAPGRVWAALTQPDEITRWWAAEARVTPEVGALGEFRFRPPAGVLQFVVAELDPDEQVRWLSRHGPPAWAGTSVTWHLTPVPNGTRVVFTHDGFARWMRPMNKPAGIGSTCLYSLKSYLETGQGTPGTPPFLK